MQDLPTLPIWFEVVWMTINCGFGAAIARSRDTPVFGTLFAGVLVGLGGGMVRDVLLGLEPVAISTWYYLPAGAVGAVCGALLYDRVVAWPPPLLLLHGITLGFLVTIGTQKAIAYDAPWFSAMALGVVTASFGGMVADVMTAHRAVLASQAHWVASALCVGAMIFWVIDELMMRVDPGNPTAGLWIAVLPTVAVVATLRLASVIRNWPSPSWPGEVAAG
ncbi:MAG: TRIC cation channel family protein [Candidatus Nanopelagicales bacterium]